MHSYPNLLKETTLGSLKLPNRAVLSPMTRTSAEPNGLANNRMAQYYQRFAKGGFGLIITEGLYPDDVQSQSYLNQPGMANHHKLRPGSPSSKLFIGRAVKSSRS